MRHANWTAKLAHMQFKVRFSYIASNFTPIMISQKLCSEQIPLDLQDLAINFIFSFLMLAQI